ncbi:MAG: hypothetical protein KKH28_12610 [Elusimicrobia bacterium]|nr:hypothetical protein [Elusimicrobiota bacterium]
MPTTLIHIIWLTCLLTANAFAENLHCVSYNRNSLSGVRTYTDCSDNPYALPGNDGISWFYNSSRMDNFFRQKKAEKIYTREFLLRTGITPGEADKIIAYKDRTSASPAENEAINPEKVNFNILELAASELFVYSSTGQQKNLIDSYYDSLMSPKHISAKTTPEQKAELKQRLAKLTTGLSTLRALLKVILSYENFSWGASAADVKKLDADIAAMEPNLYGFSREISGAQAKIGFRFMRDKLISITMSFKPLNISRVELEQLRLLISESCGWPSDCKSLNGGDLTCAWSAKSGIRINISSLPHAGSTKELNISLSSQKLMDELLGDKKGAAQ